MGEFAGFDLDRSTARAWSRFQARLADRLAEMGDDDILLIDAEVAEDDADGAAPYVQFAGFGDGTMLRGEVSSNAYLAAEHQLDMTQCARLTALGFSAPTAGADEDERDGSTNFFADLPVGSADRLAVMTVKALREVFGIAHPAFLLTELAEDPAAPSSRVHEPAADEYDEPLAVMPGTAEELGRLVDRALTPLLGAAPIRDDDGDIPIPWGSSLVFVRVDEGVPVVQLFSIVVDGVTDHARAAFEVGVLNRDVRFIKFLLVEDRVMAQVHLPAWPFVPEHLRSMLAGMSQKIDEIDEDLVARIGGHRAFEAPEEEPEEDPETSRREKIDPSDDTALSTLLQLDPDGSGAVDAEMAAGVCGFDQALIVRLLRKTEEQEVAWRKSRDEALLAGDPDEANACDHELQAWESTTSLLRRALRLVVERALGRGSEPGASYPEQARPAPRRPAPPRRRIVGDVEDLLRLYEVEDLDDLDDELSERSVFDVEVFDLEHGVEVQVKDHSGTLDYPFELADFEELVAELEGAAIEDALPE